MTAKCQGCWFAPDGADAATLSALSKTLFGIARVEYSRTECRLRIINKCSFARSMVSSTVSSIRSGRDIGSYDMVI